MIKIENITPPSTDQWGMAILGARNPMNSWNKSDSQVVQWHMLEIGENDLGLMKRLVAAGTDHSKFLRFLPVVMDITAPLYWWSEYDTYKVGTVANSCSKMHKIHTKEFSMNDFSTEHLISYESSKPYSEIDGSLDDEYTYYLPKDFLDCWIIPILNKYRKKYLETKDKTYWWQMIQLLPSSYNQKRTVMLNYAVLRNMYHARKNHKLDEWRDFCEWIKVLPYSELITMESGNQNSKPISVEDAMKTIRNELVKHGDLYDGFQASVISAIFENSDITDSENAVLLAQTILDRVIGEKK